MVGRATLFYTWLCGEWKDHADRFLWHVFGVGDNIPNSAPLDPCDVVRHGTRSVPVRVGTKIRTSILTLNPEPWPEAKPFFR